MNKTLQSLLPRLHQEFVLVVFLMVPYILWQFDLPKDDLYLVSGILTALLIVWLIKVFMQQGASSQYKGFIVFVTGLSLFIAGLYASIVYYLGVVTNLGSSILSFLYLFFPVWVMLEGALLLFLLGFDSSISLVDLERKIIIKRPTVGDILMVAVATLFLVLLGHFVLALPWYMNVCVIFTVNLIIINQFSE
ncbi:MAG: hypothetical protein ACPGO5_00230 [Patescibacteria group bacterium]